LSIETNIFMCHIAKFNKGTSHSLISIIFF
jgi:hypothetical protein